MGNLPVSRTVTLTPADPVPANLLNEMQDAIVGTKRKPFSRRISPQFLFQSGGANGFEPKVNPSGASAPNVFGNAGSTDSQIAAGSWDEGDRIIGARIEMYGNAVNDLTFQVFYAASPSSALVLKGTQTVIAGPASWQTISIVSFTPVLLVPTDILRVRVAVNGSIFYLGDVTLLYDRL